MAHLVIHIIPGKEYRVEGEFTETTRVLSQLSISTTENKPLAHNISLYDVTAKKLAISEPEWILVYIHFSTKDHVTRSEILESYKQTHRYSYNISKNLSHNLKQCLKKNWLTTTDGVYFSLLPTGRSHIEEILARSV